jgi:hypothetical protein
LPPFGEGACAPPLESILSAGYNSPAKLESLARETVASEVPRDDDGEKKFP